MHDDAITALKGTGNLDSVALDGLAVKGQSDLAKAAVRGWIQTRPDMAKKFLDEGKFDKELGGDAKFQMYGELDRHENAVRVDLERQKSLEKEAIHKTREANYDSLLQLHMDGKLDAKTVMNTDLSPAQHEHLTNVVERQVVAPNSLKTNPAKVTSLFDRLHLPDGDPSKIENTSQLDEEFKRGGVSPENLRFLRGELKKGETDDGKREQSIKHSATSMIKDTIMRSAGPKDPRAPEMNYRAQQEYLKQYDAGIAKGKTPAELSDPDFVKSVVKPFVRTPQQKLESKVQHYQKTKEKAGGSKPADMQKSMADYLKQRGLN